TIKTPSSRGGVIGSRGTLKMCWGKPRAGSSPAPGTGVRLSRLWRTSCHQSGLVARSIWSGVISFGMVSIPVNLYPPTQDKDVSFHLLHQPDHSRIRFKRFCGAEDAEVDQDDLVRAYEVGKEQYVEITDADLEQLPLPARHTIELSAFVKSAEI